MHFRFQILILRATWIFQDTAEQENVWIVFGAQKYEYILAV